MEQCRPLQDLVPFPVEKRTQVDALLKQAVAQAGIKIMVLDDDPTGVQTVHGVSVYTKWDKETLTQAFLEQGSLFFLLTNSRALTAAQTTLLHETIMQNALDAAQQVGCDFITVSRSDSTLRGHYPLETEIVRHTLEQHTGQSIDGEVLCPFFHQGGRYTLDDTHYVQMGSELVPAAQTEFAKDKTFGYTHSHLPQYIEEKTSGKTKAKDVLCFSLEELRTACPNALIEKLMQAENFQKIVVNATDSYDVKAFCIALYGAMARGKRFCIRCAAALVQALGNIADKPLLTRAEMISDNEGIGVIVVGSHTAKTTQQLEALLMLPYVQPIALQSDLVLLPGALQAESLRISHACASAMRRGKTPVVFTSRSLLSLPDDTPEAALQRSVEISEAVQQVVAQLPLAPAYVVAKGGITSSDIGTKALHVTRAEVLGQIQPGVPVWKTGSESRFPHIPYVIFPGNVGDETSLRNAVEILQAKTTLL